MKKRLIAGMTTCFVILTVICVPAGMWSNAEEVLWDEASDDGACIVIESESENGGTAENGCTAGTEKDTESKESPEGEACAVAGNEAGGFSPFFIGGGGFFPDVEFILYLEFTLEIDGGSVPLFYLDVGGDPRSLDLPVNMHGQTDTGWRIPCVVEWRYDDFDSSLPGDNHIFGYASMSPDYDPSEFGTSFADSCQRVVSLTIVVGGAKPEPEPEPEPRLVPDDGRMYLLSFFEPMPGIIISDWNKVVDQPELWMAAGDGDMQRVRDPNNHTGQSDLVMHVFNNNDGWMSLLIDLSAPSTLSHGHVYVFEVRYAGGGISADGLLVDLTGAAPDYKLLDGDRGGNGRREQELPPDDSPPAPGNPPQPGKKSAPTRLANPPQALDHPGDRSQDDPSENGSVDNPTHIGNPNGEVDPPGGSSTIGTSSAASTMKGMQGRASTTQMDNHHSTMRNSTVPVTQTLPITADATAPDSNTDELPQPGCSTITDALDIALADTSVPLVYPPDPAPDQHSQPPPLAMESADALDTVFAPPICNTVADDGSFLPAVAASLSGVAGLTAYIILTGKKRVTAQGGDRETA